MSIMADEEISAEGTSLGAIHIGAKKLQPKCEQPKCKIDDNFPNSERIEYLPAKYLKRYLEITSKKYSCEPSLSPLCLKFFSVNMP